MRLYNIRGVEVEFPFEAYDCQLVYMNKVIECLQTVRDSSSLLCLLAGHPKSSTPLPNKTTSIPYCVYALINGEIERECAAGEPNRHREDLEPPLRHPGLATLVRRKAAVQAFLQSISFRSIIIGSIIVSISINSAAQTGPGTLRFLLHSRSPPSRSSLPFHFPFPFPSSPHCFSSSLPLLPPVDEDSLPAPKIIYASRTHSQLSQAISELKTTSYKYVCSAMTLESSLM